MATLHFAATDFKAFNPVSSALANLPNGAGTLIALFKRTTTGGTDIGGLRDSTGTSGQWYHCLSHPASNQPYDDAGAAGAPIADGTLAADTTNWWFLAVDWASSAGVATAERFHWRNQTGTGAGSPGSWTHSTATPNSNGNEPGPTTAAGIFRIGYHGDESGAAKDMAVYAVWAGTRFSDTDYGDFRKTSDLYNHALGHPTFLVELTATSPADLIGGSTYSSASSSGTALTGGTPDNWTFDGVGSGGGGSSIVSPLQLLGPSTAATRAATI